MGEWFKRFLCKYIKHHWHVQWNHIGTEYYTNIFGCPRLVTVVAKGVRCCRCEKRDIQKIYGLNFAR